MRETYIPNQHTYNQYKTALNNDYGYIYNVQTGSGIGGFLKKMLNFIIPVGRSALHKGFELAKPELSKLANKGAEELGKYTMKQIGKANQNLQNRLVKKRKVTDSLT